MSLIIPEHYDPKLSVRETEAAIRYIRETFQDEIGRELNLQRMSAPMFVEKKTGLNDNLNGVEQPVSFTMKELPGETIEVVHSLAKWKRYALKIAPPAVLPVLLQCTASAADRRTFQGHFFSDGLLPRPR